MASYKVKIAYKGSQYFGWQAQSADTRIEQKPTVQGAIKRVLAKIAKGDDYQLIAASRTDAGVHAQGQLAKITLPKAIAADKLQRGMNSLLPGDIRIVTCENCAVDYSPTRSAKSKDYRYYFSTAAVDNPLLSDTMAHVCVPMDMTKMMAGCELFVGEYDFYNFSTRDQSAATTVRIIYSCKVNKENFGPLGDEVYSLDITGNGFLKHMIRYIAGCLFALLRDEITLDDIRLYLQARQQDKLAARAKSKGLHLLRVIE